MLNKSVLNDRSHLIYTNNSVRGKPKLSTQFYIWKVKGSKQIFWCAQGVWNNLLWSHNCFLFSVLQQLRCFLVSCLCQDSSRIRKYLQVTVTKLLIKDYCTVFWSQHFGQCNTCKVHVEVYNLICCNGTTVKPLFKNLFTK